ncbi:VanZ family protein [Lewinella cohaerens]|uniref:VanZ family protein n=1 Tax=Lewinella cohaerens TaxID=70995 RepID=UPI00037C6094|nr:VanZ family protein [Lewinella cohaerens]
MKQLAIKQLFWPVLALSFLAFIFWIIIQADLGQSIGFSKFVRHLPFGDKLGHFFLYGVLAFLVNLALKNRKIAISGHQILLGGLLVLVFAILEEFTQMALSTRNFELWDMFCDLLGITLFSWLALRISKPEN